MGNASTRREATLTVEICMNDLTVSRAKALARGMIERMAALGLPMTLAQALEAVAASYRYSDWNRFREALKRRKVSSDFPSEVKYPPHRLIVSKPGFGSGAVIDHGFTFEALQPESFPIMVRTWGAYDHVYLDNLLIPQWGEVIVNGYFQEGEEPTMVFDKQLAAEAQGMIINLWSGAADAPSSRKRLTAQQWRPAWLAFRKALLDLLQPEHLEKDGTLFIPDFHQFEHDQANDYDVLLPDLMKDLRAFGGKKALVVVTQTDAAQDSLYRSPDAWRLIMMDGEGSKLFYRSPFERVNIIPRHPVIQTFYARLFADPDRYLEDAALLVGRLSNDCLSVPLLTESTYGQLLIDTLKAGKAWHAERIERVRAGGNSVAAQNGASD